ncbi:retrovirus-related pol polyprotein from transposon TNT 1-94 [Tanacetum coccineum]
MELYIQSKDNGQIILNSVENGPLIWPTVALENGTIRPKTYEELSDKEKLQADYDLKATNILLMQGTSLSKQERDCKLYDEFDKLSYVKGERLHQYYLRFAQLINDMKIIQMTMQPIQVNTKFLNSLPPEWGLTVPTFLPGDDPIACINKSMAFLSAVFTPRYPLTNNQLRSSSNLRNQVTVQDGRVTIQHVQGRQGQNVVGSGSQRNTSISRGNTSGQVNVIRCYNCQGEWHMDRQCTQPKRRRDATRFKEKVLLILSKKRNPY